jgi:hypothetical protein
VGDPVFCTAVEQASFTVSTGDGALLTVSGIKSNSNLASEKAFGVTLAPGTSTALTITGDSVDNGAATTNGALGHLHIPATAAGNWSVKIQDSPNDAAWADLITFVADGSVITAEQKTAAGTVDRYTRALVTRTGGTTTFWIALVRQ